MPGALLGAALLAAAASPGARAGWGAAGADASGEPQTQRITYGQRIPITEAPWQVRLQIGADRLCGGSILDERHIITAAHCTYDGLTPVTAGQITVVSGSSSFDPLALGAPPNGPAPPDSPISSSVKSVRRHPGYIASPTVETDARRGRDDVAVLTLYNPLSLDGVVRQAVALPAQNTETPPGTVLSVTGFGVQSEDSGAIDGKLHRLSDMRVLDPVAPAGEWNALYVTATSDTGLVCSGDSGGPLISGSGTSAVLVGIVSFTRDCNAGTTAVFTNVAAGELREFILGTDTPPAAPTGGRDVLLTADQSGALPLRPGRTLSCAPGTWTNNPQIAIRFADVVSGLVLQEGPQTTYAIGDGDVGRRISCSATATTAGGVGRTPWTESPPAVQPTPVPAVTSLSASLRTAASSVRRGRTFGLTLRVRAGVVAARDVRACVTLPTRWQVTRRGTAKASGRTVCVARSAIPANGSLTASVRVRPTSRAVRGRTRLQLRATASNAATVRTTRTLRVR